MGDHNDGDTVLVVQPGDELVQLRRGLGVQPRSRLIQQQHGAGGAQGAGQQDPLLLAAGQLPVAAPGQGRDVQLFQGMFSKLLFCPAVKGASAAAPLAAGEHDLPYRGWEVLLDLGLLRQIADLVGSQPVACQDLAPDGRLEAENRFHERTFSSAVFPHDAEVIARENLKIQMLHDGFAVIAD